MSKELDLVVGNYTGILVVNVRGMYDNMESEFDQFLQSLEKSTDRVIRIVNLTSSGHKNWLNKHNIFGSPAILVFNNGELCLRIHGRISVGLFNRLLEDRVL
jgi:hypothetical protein